MSDEGFPAPGEAVLASDGSLLLGARRIPLATLGLLQYVSPSLHLLLGVWLFNEPLAGNRLVGFVLIWIALALYSLEGWRRARQR
mgnify:CR=1 FL=1